MLVDISDSILRFLNTFCKQKTLDKSPATFYLVNYVLVPAPMYFGVWARTHRVELFALYYEPNYRSSRI